MTHVVIQQGPGPPLITIYFTWVYFFPLTDGSKQVLTEATPSGYVFMLGGTPCPTGSISAYVLAQITYMISRI